ncbi:uncharacterized protein LOC127288609 isoform X2 [Leptopilina boulardi]|uniref:uncharacterized protein LOC127288609 isoform X2 n=1 Tax=Leptopilina boulardi TaxID=63433 RepID=UPI0021F568F8|nr:uncharacterized protein LOC127288609 isoform X2 [Leptopilina boulardi]
MAAEWLNDFNQRPLCSTDLPHGMRNYDHDALSFEQKEKLNSMKVDQRKQNESYLYKHPEIKDIY